MKKLFFIFVLFFASIRSLFASEDLLFLECRPKNTIYAPFILELNLETKKGYKGLVEYNIDIFTDSMITLLREPDKYQIEIIYLDRNLGGYQLALKFKNSALEGSKSVGICKKREKAF